MKRFKIEIEGKSYVVEVEEIIEEELPPIPLISRWKIRGREQNMIPPLRSTTKWSDKRFFWRLKGRQELMVPKTYKGRGIKG